MFFSKSKKEIKVLFNKLYNSLSISDKLKIDIELQLIGLLHTRIYSSFLRPFYSISRHEETEEVDNLIYSFFIKSLDTNVFRDNNSLFYFGGNNNNNRDNYINELLLCILNRNNADYVNLIKPSVTICITPKITFDKMIFTLYEQYYGIILERIELKRYYDLKKKFCDFTKNFFSETLDFLKSQSDADTHYLALNLIREFSDGTLNILIPKLQALNNGTNINENADSTAIDNSFCAEKNFFFNSQFEKSYVKFLKTLTENNSDTAEVKTIKKWSNIIYKRIATALEDADSKILVEIIIFLYFSTDFHLSTEMENALKRKNLLTSISVITDTLFEATNKFKTYLFNNRLKNYYYLLKENNNTYDINLIHKIIHYQAELIGKITQSGYFSFYDCASTTNEDQILDVLTKSRVITPLMESRSDYLSLMFELEYQKDSLIQKELVMRTLTNIKGIARINLLVPGLIRYHAKDLIDIYQLKNDQNFQISEKGFYSISSSISKYVRLYYNLPKGERISFNYLEPFKDFDKRRFWEHISCVNENLFEYFLCQYVFDLFSAADEYYETYTIISDEDSVKKYQLLLSNNPIISAIYYTGAYPAKIQDESELHVGVFTKEHSGVFFKIIKVKNREHFSIEYSTLLEGHPDETILF